MGGNQPQQQSQPPMYYAQPYNGKRPLRTADAIISIVLLVLGFIGMLLGIVTALVLETSMQDQYTLYGLGTYDPPSSLVAMQAIVIVAHLLLFVISTPITILLIVKRQISFWVPLTAGVIATLVFWGVLFGLMLSDPILMDGIQRQQ
jgi:hypothetical protein